MASRGPNQPGKLRALGLAEYFMWVAASWADRDLFFPDFGVVAGAGASAGSRRPESSPKDVIMPSRRAPPYRGHRRARVEDVYFTTVNKP